MLCILCMVCGFWWPFFVLCSTSRIGSFHRSLRSTRGAYPTSIPNWCRCGNCRIMDSLCENVCCRKSQCVITFEDFHLQCTEHSVLTTEIHNRPTDRIDYSPRSYRRAAYHQYTVWVHGNLGHGNRRVIPSCVVWCIRNWYPSPDCKYMGFREQK